MRLLFALPVIVLLALACGGNSDDPATSGGATPTPVFTGCRPFAPLSPDTHTIRISKASDTTATVIVQLADSPSERGTGLSDHECLPDDSGMLFAFPEDTSTSFQMRETEVPLSIAFIQADGEIVQMLDMEPLSSAAYESPVPYRYTIEVAQGWFAENGVAVGDIAEIEDTYSQNSTN